MIRSSRIFIFSHAKKSIFRFSTVKSLKVSCTCGNSSIVAEGDSMINYNCHSKSTRLVTNKDFTQLSAFKPNQITTTTSLKLEYCQNDSKITHYLCNCEKKIHLAENLNRTQGLIAFNVEGLRNQSKLPVEYQPNHHFHYSERKTDVNDNLPKWKTVIDGEIIPSSNSSQVAATQKSQSHPGNNLFEYNSSTGGLFKDVLPLSPLVPAEPLEYTHTEQELL
jgi:hypothetical protein